MKTPHKPQTPVIAGAMVATASAAPKKTVASASKIVLQDVAMVFVIQKKTSQTANKIADTSLEIRMPNIDFGGLLTTK